MNKLVFIIDDDPVYLQFMQSHFRQMGGFEVEEYSIGSAALEQLENKDPFMIILDHHLNDPSGDGLHYLRLFKKKKGSVPILYITSDSTESLKNKVLKKGAKALIVKSDSFLVQLRTAIDEITTYNQKGFFSKLFSS